MTDLASRVETEPPSRELADEVLKALGRWHEWTAIDFLARRQWDGRPNPLTSASDAFDLVDCALYSIELHGTDTHCIVRLWTNPEDRPAERHEGQTVNSKHAIPRALTAALIRAMEAGR